MKRNSLEAAVEAACKRQKTTRCKLAAKVGLSRSSFTRIRQGLEISLPTLRLLRGAGVKHPLVEAA
jgi:transcriptional regulator with XRE-family HTH domain